MMNLIQESLPNGNIAIIEDMVLIPAGSFLMGSESGSEFEKPVHGVYLDAYLIDAAPVTNAQFGAFVEATGYSTTAEREGLASADKPSWRTFATPDRKDHPVVCVSWYDAVAFAKSVGKRLPTEAEWEKAARGNLESKLFPWGDERVGQGRSNWNQAQMNSLLEPPTTPVKNFPANDYRLYDMAGNVWEWCADWYLNEYYSVSPSHNPQGPEDGQFRVRRGASWNVREEFRLRCANRGAMPPEKFWPNMGFRCVISM